jgi:hypothetical protein
MHSEVPRMIHPIEAVWMEHARLVFVQRRERQPAVERRAFQLDRVVDHCLGEQGLEVRILFLLRRQALGVRDVHAAILCLSLEDTSRYSWPGAHIHWRPSLLAKF